MPKKTFMDGDALPASDLNTYLMNQSVQTYSAPGARDSALPSPLEGQVTTNATSKNLETYYDQWRPLPFAMQTGLVNITPVANVPTSVAVTWGVGRFTQQPIVFATVQSNATGVLNGAATATTSGGTISFLANNTTSRNVGYMAVQMLNNNASG
jgi:hypothetical protein